ncbi:histidine phosphatase family protein [Actinoplanes aureus]|uniref:Histidine phosphatase family protein n=1 Tax=Actinoplanes aureus TaxID=2792083 RepID=A0A931CLA1_9ACTN|nr:histidine phosphatase family protein [Actinoplanes aureus]MBG0568338.1 histidine phosphatase family protein [Actinoplanes aureus]
MGRLLLVRHGQASFGADDYDALSELGAEQARVLGKSLAGRGLRPDLVLCGSLRRQEATAAGILEGLGDQTVPVSADPGWDEFDFQHVVEVHQPAYRDRAYLTAELARSDQPARAFQEIFEAATGRWCSGDFDTEYTESFPAFRERVADALERGGELLRQQHRDVVVVSSGGPIAMAVAQLTAGRDANPAIWAALNRVTVNTGVTKLVSGRRGLWMSTFNEHTHLESDPRLLTYR